MKEISLTQGFVALVDDADFESVNAFKWCAVKRVRGVYALRGVRRPDGGRTTLFMHQFLLGPRIDHKDGNGLNNQRHNLREATKRQNGQAFRNKPIGASSRFRGVTWAKREKKWETQIRVDGKTVFLGYFFLEKDAALAYDKAAREFFGEFAAPNFPILCRES